jgi:putative tryptophan/tyrosine transport system substrate-binding protein
MRRREFIIALSGAAIVPNLACAQQQPVPIIGRLGVAAPIGAIEAEFSRGLAEAGYVEGKNVSMERRWAAGRYDQLPALAEELLRLKPALIVTGGNVVALTAKRATSTIPILFNVASDPVKLGLVNSFARPVGNATGIATLTAPLTAKRLELIRELIPPGSIVGFLVNPDNQDVLPDIEDAAHTTRQLVQIAKARDPDDLERAFVGFSGAHVAAAVVSNDASFLAQRTQFPLREPIPMPSAHARPSRHEAFRRGLGPRQVPRLRRIWRW